jgi:regulator of sirC expression with transglutaminase-like and TPR domain
MSASLLTQFRQALSVGEDDLDLAEAALLIARQEYPDLPVGRYLERLDEMADAIRPRSGEGPGSPVDRLRSLNRYLYGELGFTGNRSRYFDPRNSFLNDVMDRRTGIPITLSLVYMEIGRRLGLPLHGVSFPGHFLVKLDLDGAAVVLDPYHGGVSLSHGELQQRAEQVFGPELPLGELMPRLLEAASKRDILLRMLRNLKAVYRERHDFERLIHIAHLILVVSPDIAREIRDRASCYEALDYSRGAIADYRRYLELAPDAEDAQSVRERLIQLQSRPSELH